MKKTFFNPLFLLDFWVDFLLSLLCISPFLPHLFFPLFPSSSPSSSLSFCTFFCHLLFSFFKTTPFLPFCFYSFHFSLHIVPLFTISTFFQYNVYILVFHLHHHQLLLSTFFFHSFIDCCLGCQPQTINFCLDCLY